MRCPVMVGREREVALLTHALDAAAAGHGGRAVVVLGEAGVGKSRLAAAAGAHAADAGLCVLRGRAVASSAPVALRPLTEAVLSGLRRLGVPQEPALDPFRAALGRLAPQYATPGASSEISLVVLAEAVLRLVRLWGAGRGVLMLLEDLHWADAETLAVVEYLADNLAGERVVVVVTARAGSEHAVVALAGALRARGAADVVELDRLDQVQAATMIRSCLGGDSPPAALDDLVLARAEGLPLLVEELLVGLQTSGELFRHDGEWEVSRAARPRVPVSFAEAVVERLRRLPAGSRAIVASAAVLGTQFDWSLLGPMAGRTDAEVLSALRVAIDAELLLSDSTGFRFRHALTRDAVLTDVLAPEHAAMAARAASAVLAHDGDSPDVRHELAAELFATAGQDGDAADRWHLAAGRDLRRGALLSARSTLERARSLAGADRDRRLAIDETLVEALGLAGDAEAALALGRAVIAELQVEPVDAARVDSARLRLARAAVASGHWRDAATQLDAIGGDDSGLVDVLRAQVAMGEQRLSDATHLARRALDGAERSARHEITCEAWEVIGRAARVHDLAEAEAAFGRAYECSDAHGLLLWRVRALHELGTIDLLDWRCDDRRLVAAKHAASDIGALSTVAVVNLQLNAMRLITADLDGALDAITECVDSARRWALPLLPKALLHLAAIHGVRGHQQEMDDAIAQARQVAPDDPEVPAGQYGHARFLQALWRGDDRRALAMLDGAMPVYRAHPGLPTPFRGMWALLHTVLGDGTEARAEVRDGPQLTTRFNSVVLHYADAVALGRAGRVGEAAATYASVQDTYPGTRSWMDAHVRRMVATAALRDGWGEPEAWLRQALAWFDARELADGAAACRAALRTAGLPVPRAGRVAAATVPDHLRALGVTPREMEVLLLIADGLSNGQIAERLYISQRTVETHVAHLLRRTGARSRAEVLTVTRRPA